MSKVGSNMKKKQGTLSIAIGVKYIENELATSIPKTHTH
jgi:hypothetical protein